jgi:hypothetical protein
MKSSFIHTLLIYLLLCILPDFSIATDTDVITTLLATTQKIKKRETSDDLYTSLLEQLTDEDNQPIPQTDAESPMEPWILQLFGTQLQHTGHPSFTSSDSITDKRQTLISLLSLSLAEYRKRVRE